MLQLEEFERLSEVGSAGGEEAPTAEADEPTATYTSLEDEMLAKQRDDQLGKHRALRISIERFIEIH